MGKRGYKNAKYKFMKRYYSIDEKETKQQMNQRN